MKKIILTVLSLVMLSSVSPVAAADRWRISDDGAINWEIKANDPHSDHLEMSGQKISVVLRYGVDASGAFSLNRSLVFPMLRMKPNKTQNNLKQRFDVNIPALVTIDDLNMTDEKVSNIKFDGIMTVESSFSHVYRRKKVDNAVSLRRVLYPSINGAYYCEEYTFTNNMQNPITLRRARVEREIYHSGRGGCLRFIHHRGVAVEKRSFHSQTGREVRDERHILRTEGVGSNRCVVSALTHSATAAGLSSEVGGIISCSTHPTPSSTPCFHLQNSAVPKASTTPRVV